jgi:hypothetical protein
MAVDGDCDMTIRDLRSESLWPLHHHAPISPGFAVLAVSLLATNVFMCATHIHSL